MCECVKEGSLNLVNRRFGSRKGFFFFPPSLQWEVYCFEFDRSFGIVEIFHAMICTVFLRSIYFSNISNN